MGEGPTQSSCSPWVVPRHWGAEPRSDSCLGKHHQQSRTCSALSSLTPPHPQREKNAEEKQKKKGLERRAGKEKPFLESCTSARQEKPGEGGREPMGGFALIPCPGRGARGAGIRGTAEALGRGRDGSLLLVTGARPSHACGAEHRCWRGGAHRKRGQVTLWHPQGHAGRSEVGVCGCPRVSVGLGRGGFFSRPSSPRGCWGLAAKSWRRRGLPRAPSCPGPHGSPPRQPPMTAPHLPAQPQGWQFKPPFAWE